MYATEGAQPVTASSVCACVRACVRTRQFLEVRTELDDVPNIEELVQAMRHLNFGTAGGASGIVPEMLIYGGVVVRQRLLALIKEVYGILVRSLWNGMMQL